MRKLFVFLVIGSMLFVGNVPVFAAAATHTLSGNATWAGTGSPTQVDITHAAAGDNVNVNGHILEIKNDQTANDGSGVNIFNIGDITDGGLANGTAVSRIKSVNDITVNIKSVNVTNAFTVENSWLTAAHRLNNTTEISGSLTAGGNLSVTNHSTAADKNVNLIVGGDLDIGDTATIWGNANLELKGSTVGVLNGFKFENTADGRPVLTFSGTGDQVVAGTIDGFDESGEGTLNVNGTGDTTFNNNIGNTYSLLAVNIASVGTKTAQFDGVVRANTITMSGAGKAQFNGALTATALNITSSGQAEIKADSAVTTTTIGSGKLDLKANLTGTTLTFTGTGQAVVADTKNITANITNTSGSDGFGTITTEGDSIITGTVGTAETNERFGALNINGAGGTITHITGTVYAKDATIGSGELKLDSDANITTTTVGAGTLDLGGSLTGTTLAFTGDGAAVIAHDKNITANITNASGSDNRGNLTTAGNSVITGNIGEVGFGKSFGSLNINGALGTTAEITGKIYATDATLGAGIIIFGDSAFISTVTLGSGLLFIEKGLYGTDLNFLDDGMAILSDGKSITSNIKNTSGVNNGGILSTLGDADITETVGGAGVNERFGLLDITGISGTTARIYKAVYAKEATIGAGTLRLDNASDIETTTFSGAGTLDLKETLTGDIVFAAGGDGTVTLLGGNNIIGTVDNKSGSDGIGTLIIEAGGNSNISGEIGATNTLKQVDIATGTVTFSGDVGVETFSFSGDGIANINNGKNMTLGSGGITSASGEGTLTLLGAHTITGNIGSTLLGNDGLKLLTVGNGLVTINGNIKALKTNFAADNELIVGSGYSITGNVITSNPGEGTLSFAGSTSTGGDIGESGTVLKAVNFNGATDLYHNILATNTNINSGSTVTASGNRTVTGNINVKDGATLDFGSTTLTVSGGAFSSDNNSTISPQISNTTTGKVEATGAVATVNDGTKIFVDVVGHIPQNHQFIIMKGGAGSSIGTIPDANITDDSRRFYFKQFTDPLGESLILKGYRFSTFEDDGKNPNAKAVGRALDLIDDGTATGDMLHVIDVLDALSDDEIGDALEAMEPERDRGIIDTAKLSIGRLINTISSHLGMHRGTGTGIATGDSRINTKDIWAKAFGTYAKQDKRKDIEGYRADVIGGAFGIDFVASEKATIGFSGGYSYGKVKSNQTGIGNTTADSIQGSIYYGYNNELNYLGVRAMYIDLVGSFAYNMYEGKRNIAFGSINRQAKADYDGQQYTVYGEAGYHIPKDNIDFIPLVSLQYTRLNVDSYTEKGADSLNLRVGKQHYDLLELGLGLKIASIIRREDLDIIPSVRGKWLYDFIGDRAETASRFADYGPSFKTQGAKPPKNSFDIGTTLTFLGKNNVQIDLDYDFNVKSKYQSHNGAVTLKYKF
jgi:uncharacterized protein with beta-barrel porin domain